jgi:hypothetical protein
MAQCDLLLRAASSVAEEVEKARAALTKAAQDAQNQIVALPNVAAHEAERIRISVTTETEKARVVLNKAAQDAQNQIVALPHVVAQEAERIRISVTTETEKARRAEQGGSGRAKSNRRLANVAAGIERMRESMRGEAEKARVTVTKAAEELQRYIVSLPSIAAQEAERVRETVRNETELMLDASARTLATLQTRISAKRPVPPTTPTEENAAADAANSEPPGQSLRGMARRITAPKAPPQPRDRSKGGGYELSEVLAAAESRETPKANLKPGANAALGQLQSALADLAGELNELAGETADPALWRRYLEGDRNVFARRLAASIGPDSVNRITSLYRDNPRFGRRSGSESSALITVRFWRRDSSRLDLPDGGHRQDLPRGCLRQARLD